MNDVLVNFENFFEKFQRKNQKISTFTMENFENYFKFFFNFGTFREQTIKKFSNTTEDV